MFHGRVAPLSRPVMKSGGLWSPPEPPGALGPARQPMDLSQGRRGGSCHHAAFLCCVPVVNGPMAF